MTLLGGLIRHATGIAICLVPNDSDLADIPRLRQRIRSTLIHVENLIETVGGQDPFGPSEQGLLAGLLDPLLYRVG